LAWKWLRPLPPKGLKPPWCITASIYTRMFEEEISVLIKEKLQERGIALHFDASIDSIKEQGDGVRIKTAQEELDADLVLLALRVQPNSELARD